jgi:hypothetical protein
VTAVLVDTAVLKHRNTAVYWNTAKHRGDTVPPTA